MDLNRQIGKLFYFYSNSIYLSNFFFATLIRYIDLLQLLLTRNMNVLCNTRGLLNFTNSDNFNNFGFVFNAVNYLDNTGLPFSESPPTENTNFWTSNAIGWAYNPIDNDATGVIYTDTCVLNLPKLYLDSRFSVDLEQEKAWFSLYDAFNGEAGLNFTASTEYSTKFGMLESIEALAYYDNNLVFGFDTAYVLQLENQYMPSSLPSAQPSSQPVYAPSHLPTRQPSSLPTCQPSGSPTRLPSLQPFVSPSSQPSTQPSTQPFARPTVQPTLQPSSQPSHKPSGQPSRLPTKAPSSGPTLQPSSEPSMTPSCQPSSNPSTFPSISPSLHPTMLPTSTPSQNPTLFPSVSPSGCPSTQPSRLPTISPSGQPSIAPTSNPSVQPTCLPTRSPSTFPSSVPTKHPFSIPSSAPTTQPSLGPTTFKDESSLIYDINIDMAQVDVIQDVILIVFATFGLLIGSYLYFYRESDGDTMKVGFLYLFMWIPIFCTQLGSLLLLIFFNFLMNGNQYDSIAICFVAVFVIRSSCACYTMYKIKLKNSKLSYFLNLVAKAYDTIWNVSCIITFVNPEAVKVFPWKNQPFAEIANGYPTYDVYFFTSRVGFISNCVFLVLDIAAMSFSNSTNSGNLRSIVVNFLCSLCCILYTAGIYYTKEVINEIKVKQVIIQDNIDKGTTDEKIKALLKESSETHGKMFKHILSQNSSKNLETLDDIDSRIDKVKTRDATMSGAAYELKLKELVVSTESVSAKSAAQAQKPSLQEIKNEVALLTSKLQNGEYYDNDRLLFLIHCLNTDPDYIEERKKDLALWQVNVGPVLAEWHSEMLSFVPPTISTESVESLMTFGYSRQLAKRILSKKCLWLIRLKDTDFARLTAEELSGKYGYDSQGLDIKELASIYVSLPNDFDNDKNGLKKKFKNELGSRIRDLYSKYESKTLRPDFVRSPAYGEFRGPWTDKVSRYSMFEKPFVEKAANTKPAASAASNATEVISPMQSAAPQQTPNPIISSNTANRTETFSPLQSVTTSSQLDDSQTAKQKARKPKPPSDTAVEVSSQEPSQESVVVVVAAAAENTSADL